MTISQRPRNDEDALLFTVSCLLSNNKRQGLLRFYGD
jgi:hypothetical protein